MGSAVWAVPVSAETASTAPPTTARRGPAWKAPIPACSKAVTWSATDALVADPNVANRVWYGGIQGVGYIENGVLTENTLSGISGTTGVQDIEIALDGSYMLVSTTNGRVYRINDFATTETVSGSPNSPAIPQGFRPLPRGHQPG